MMVNDARMVTAYGDGIHHALHEKAATFTIDTQEMQGDLKVRIEGTQPSPVFVSRRVERLSLPGPNSVIKNTLERTNDNLFKVIYVPVEVGLVNISIKWNGKDIANSPFQAAVTNPGRACFSLSRMNNGDTVRSDRVSYRRRLAIDPRRRRSDAFGTQRREEDPFRYVSSGAR